MGLLTPVRRESYNGVMRKLNPSETEKLKKSQGIVEPQREVIEAVVALAAGESLVLGRDEWKFNGKGNPISVSTRLGRSRKMRIPGRKLSVRTMRDGGVVIIRNR